MQVSPEDADLFFKLMPALQTFGNQKLQVIKNLNEVEEYQKISNEQRVNLRNTFYKKPEIIDEFVQENPYEFSQEEMEIVSSWKNFVAGDFFIQSVTKKYAIFIGNSKGRSGFDGTFSGCFGWDAPSSLCENSPASIQRENNLRWINRGV
jgi:hypothetical protein